MHRREQGGELLDVVQGEGAVDQIDRGGRQLERLEIGLPVGDRRVPRRPRARASMLADTSRPSTEAAPASARPGGTQRTSQPKPQPRSTTRAAASAAGSIDLIVGHLRRAVETVDGAPKLAVTGEEAGIVVDVLRHFTSACALCWRTRSSSAAPRSVSSFDPDLVGELSVGDLVCAAPIMTSACRSCGRRERPSSAAGGIAHGPCRAGRPRHRIAPSACRRTAAASCATASRWRS